MYEDLFVNACIIIASISIGNIIFHTPEIATIKNKILVGVLSGILGIIIIRFSVDVSDSIILDFRNLAIILSSLYGGIVSSIITGFIIGVFRLFYMEMTVSSIIGFIAPLIMGIGCGLIANLKILKWQRWIWVTLFTLVTATFFFYILIKDKVFLLDFLWPFWLGTCFLSLVLYFYTERLLTYNSLFHNFKKDASIDFLTDLYNVREFDNILNNAIFEAQQKRESLSLLFLDIDFFKKINDSYGHTDGDAILRQFGEVLKHTCRSNDLIFRKGGDEFAVLLLNCSSKTALEIAQRINVAVAGYPFLLISGTKIKLTTSIGVASYPETVDKLEAICEVADMTLYKAKLSGRNRTEMSI